MFTTLPRAILALVVVLSFAGVGSAGQLRVGVYYGGGAVSIGARYYGGFGYYGGLGYYGGFARINYGYPYFGYGYGWPSWGYYGYYGPRYYYPSWSLAFAPSYYYWPTAYCYYTPVVANYPVTTTIITRATPAEPTTAPSDELPAPSGSRSFRYDGDRPAAPKVERIPPARDLDIPMVPDLPATPGVPKLGPSPADMQVASRAATVTKKYTYPAYGEDRLSKPAPRDDKPALIRREK